jgi:hypothetical protein
MISIFPLRDRAMKLQRSRLDQEAVDISGMGRPVDFLIPPPDRAHDLNAPALPLRVGETQALEGNGHLDRIALFIYPGIGQEVSVPVAVEPFEPAPAPAPAAARTLAENSVHLDAAGIDLKDKSPFLVVECIEIDRYPVILLRFIARRQAGADGIGVRIMTAEGEVQVILVISDVGPCIFRGGPAFEGLELGKILDHRTLFPERVLEHAVDLGWGGELGEADGIPSRSGLCRLGRVRGQRRENHQDSDCRLPEISIRSFHPKPGLLLRGAILTEARPGILLP